MFICLLYAATNSADAKAFKRYGVTFIDVCIVIASETSLALHTSLVYIVI